MKAILCDQFTSFEDLTMVDVPRPDIAPGCVRIKVDYASVGYAISLMVAGRYQRKMTLPFIPGTEVSGEIIECGPGVERLSTGSRVAAIVDAGGFAEEVVIDAATVYPVPDNVSLERAVGIPLSYGTAATALERGGVKDGQRVLVCGAGGALGLAAVEVAKQKGATVIAAASSGLKLEAARLAGADILIDYKSQNLLETVRAETAGQGVDVVFDPVGGADFESLIRCTANGGSILSLGFASGLIPQAPVNLLLVKNVSLHGVNFSEYIGWGKTDRRQEFVPQMRALMEWLFSAAAAGNLNLRSPQMFDLADAKQAIACVVGRRSVGKVVLRVR
ncbi:NADPH:quinone oxidoreductase family protein [Marinobacter sp. F3R11]|uniref:NADPH:quinone oxidoreductase family protein n=1 Tax=Marinobacter sp. F3R11 TaxID=2267231 RepID=UPI0016513D38|nr:NADPH:quinone oxidoreductase family protein [Marinobacter sp. F3R11]